MGEHQGWNEISRSGLRSTIRSIVQGEVRLASQEHAAIIELCHEICIEYECPTNEEEGFVRFAESELERTISLWTSEQATWPIETDCDRLGRVEAELRNRGILLWQVSPCCDTCTRGELPDRIDEIDARHPGFRERVRGYAFFIEQNMAEMLVESTQLELYLAYGWFPPDDTRVAPSTYEEKALAIAREICDCLRKHGFEVDWDGDFSRKIGVSVNWLRRTMLG